MGSISWRKKTLWLWAKTLMCIMRWTDSYSKQKQQQHSHCVLRVYKKVRLILGKSCSHSRKSSEMYEIKWVLDVISNTISFSFLKMSHDYELNVIILRKRNFWSSFISDLSDIFYTHFFALFFHNFHTVNSKGVRERESSDNNSWREAMARKGSGLC